MIKEEFEAYLLDIGGLERNLEHKKELIFDSSFFQLSEGWYALLKDLIDELLKLGWNKQILQVKEKLGGLRFYIHYTAMPEGGWEVVHKYEEIASKTCEKCGNRGVLRNGSWLQTLCNEHADGRDSFYTEQN